MLVAFLVTAALVLGGWWYVVTERRLLVRERLLFGIEAPPAAPQEDLTDPGWGLSGLARRVHFAALFLGSVYGRLLTFAAGAGVAWGAGTFLGYGDRATGAGAAGGGLAMLAIVTWLLYRRAVRRRRQIRDELPNVLELLAALMKGGLAFESALGHMVTESDARHPLYRELATMNEAMRRGRRRIDAFRLFAQRCGQFEVSEVVGALVQADQSGASIADVMRHQAQAIFRETEAEIQRRAERLPVRMMFPLLLTIFPALFVVLLLPNLLRVFRMIAAVMGDLGSGVDELIPR